MPLRFDHSTQSDAVMRLALEASGAGSWLWNAETDHISVDERYRELYGFSAREIVTASSWQQRLFPEDREVQRRRVAASLGTGARWHDVFRIQHPTLGVRWLEGYGSACRDDAGRVLGLAGVNLDVTDRVRAAEDLKRSEAELQAVVDGVFDGIVTIDEAGIVQSCNRAAATLFKYSAADLIGRNVSMLMPEPYRSAHDGCLRAYRSTGQAQIIGIGREMVGERSDGSTFPMDLAITEAHSEGRRLFVGILRDITERKTAEDTQRLLMDELNHRVKNALATVQAMAEQTFRNTADPEQFVENFRGRLHALASAHNLLTRRTWTGVDLHQLLDEQLLLGRDDRLQISYRGPEVELRPQVGVHLGLVLHELGTNARKYGALSVSEGRLEVSWRVVAENGRSVLELNWRESGGPPVTPPRSRGFGTLLVEMGTRQTLRGTVQHTFASEGVICDIRVPNWSSPPKDASPPDAGR